MRSARRPRRCARKPALVLLGHIAQRHPQFADIRALAAALAARHGCDARLLERGRERRRRGAGGRDCRIAAPAAKCVATRRLRRACACSRRAQRAYILFGIEPSKDLANGAEALARAARRGRRRRIHAVRLRRAARRRRRAACRSARSPRRPARSSTPRVAGRASTPLRTSPATRGRAGACCACSATSSSCRTASTARRATSAADARARDRRRARRWSPAETPYKGAFRVRAARAPQRSTLAISTCRSTPSMRSCAAPSRCRRPCSRAGQGARMNALLAAAPTSLWLALPADAAARDRQRAEDRRGARAADSRRRVLHVLGAQDHRLDARTASARTASAGRACCSRSPTSSRCSSRRSCVPANANKFLFLTAPVLSLVPAFAVWAVVPFSDDIRHRGHRRGTALRARADVARRLRRHPRGLGVELEVRVPGRDALGRADGGLRDRDGLRARRRADGRRQLEPRRHHPRAAGHERLRAGSFGRCSRCSSSTSSRVSPRRTARRSTSRKASRRSSRASTSSIPASRSACSSWPSTRT